MNIAIIEDEKLVANDLQLSITPLIDGPVHIVQLYSVKEAIKYFKANSSTDLIFSDIQLGDGLSFEIFMEIPVSAPIIFCTAYDEYALEAFKTKGIDYILKPFSTQSLELALQRYHELKKIFSPDPLNQYDTLLQMLSGREQQTATSVLVYHQDKIIPVKLEDTAVCYLHNEIIHLVTFSGKVYYPNKNLDELEKLSGSNFFRVNRQFLVCRKSVTDVSNFFSRKLVVNLNIPLEEKVIVSKGKASSFLKWLASS